MDEKREEQESPVCEIRTNPIVPTDAVIISTARSKRPVGEKKDNICPFCVGNEGMTPPAIAEIPDKKDWQIRIVNNKFPVLRNSVSLPGYAYGQQQAADGYGLHEIFIDHPAHDIKIHEMSGEHIALIFSTYRDRMKQIYQAFNRIKYISLFKNFGPAAGASIRHTHSQLLAMPIVPRDIIAEVRHTAEYYQKNSQCIFCDLINEMKSIEVTLYDWETKKIRRKINMGAYIIEASDRFIAIKPFASMIEWEVHILPLGHEANFLKANKEDMNDLAGLLKRTMTRLNAVLGGELQYNYFLHSLPRGNDYKDKAQSYHWHLEITPRTTIPSGIELSSGYFVNTISPEDAAERLRSVKL